MAGQVGPAYVMVLGLGTEVLHFKLFGIIRCTHFCAHGLMNPPTKFQNYMDQGHFWSKHADVQSSPKTRASFCCRV